MRLWYTQAMHPALVLAVVATSPVKIALILFVALILMGTWSSYADWSEKPMFRLGKKKTEDKEGKK